MMRAKRSNLVVVDMRAELRMPPNARGFTLVEVLATLVLLGIVLPAVMKGASVGLAAASAARHTTEASDLARSKLNDLVAENLWSQSASGDFSPDYPNYKWQVMSKPVGENGLDSVQITVTWNEMGKERKLTQTTLVYDTSTDNGTTDTSNSNTTTGGTQ